MKRVALEPAYLLSSRAYRESSLLLEVFSLEHGRVGLVARGVRSARSKLAGVLQPFRRLLLSWSERGELGTLGAVEAGGAVPGMSGETVFLGWYVNELMLRLLHRRDPHPGLFADYEVVLAALPGVAPQPALRIFEKRLLTELGYGLRWPARIDAAVWYEDDPDEGLRPAGTVRTAAIRGSSLQALAEENLVSAEALADARRLLRAALQRHLGDYELRTPDLLRSLRRGVRREKAHA
jgi:DNA repair protein RecO (recombination protein O)